MPFQNNLGGNLPILVDPLAKAIGYRESISIFYAGFYFLSSILFFITMFWMQPAETTPTRERDTTTLEIGKRISGQDNIVFTTSDERDLPRNIENSKL